MMSNGKKDKKLNKKKVITTVVIIACLIGIIVFSFFYSENKKFMNFCDQYIFKKNVTEENSKIIEISNSKETNIYAYKQYILILKDNSLTAYNKYGHEEYKIDIEISNPIFSTSGDYLCVAEKNGQKIYMISGQNIVWQKDVEGEISNLSINKNGYCAILLSGKTYKTTIQVYNSKGTELFKKYLSKAIAISTDISNDNKYLAVAEVNYEGIVIQSTIEIISIETAITDSENAQVYAYNAPADNLIVKINYQSKNNLLCMYDKYIDYINSSYENKELLKFEATITNADINMSDNILTIKNMTKGFLKNQALINIMNTTSQEIKTYEINDVAEEVYVKDNMILINLGTEILFLNEKGWLVKKYIGSKEIKDFVFTNEIAGIIYKNKIEIISL